MSIKSKKIAIAGATVLIFAVAGFAFYKLRNSSEPAGQPTSPINYNPPTSEEEAESQARKQELREQQNQQSAYDSNKQVEPLVTSAYQSGQEIFLSAYVPGITENEGKCTYTVTKNGQSVTKVTEGFVNVSNTNCTPASISRAEFNQTGDWQVTVAYRSSSASGTSQFKVLTVK